MANYYVSRNGTDNNDGRSADSPWKSISKGVNALSAGDTLFIMKGTYDPGQEDLDNWLVANKNGTPTQPITIRNYENDEVILTGRESGAGDGYPQSGLEVHPRSVTYEGITYKLTNTALFDVVDCSYLTLDGLQIIDSLGEGLDLRGTRANSYEEGASGALLHHITVKNCRVHNTRQRNVKLLNVWDVKIENCEFSFGSWAFRGGSGGPNVVNGYYVYFDHNVIHQQAGESIIADGNNWPSRNIYIRNNVLFDCEDAISLHAVKYVICVGNYFYNTMQDYNAEKGFVGSASKGISAKPSECQLPNQKPTEYVLIAHNVVVNRPVGILTKTDSELQDNCPDGWRSEPIRHVYIVYNTVVNSIIENFRIATDNASSCFYKTNISVHSSEKGHLGTNGRESNGWEADYNIYSTTPQLPDNLSGPHDIKNVDPRLVGVKPPDKGPVSLQNAGYYANFTLVDGFNDATNFRIKEDSPCIDTAPTLSAPNEWPEMNEYLDWSYDFAMVGINPRRTGSWDIGAHEYIKEGLKADFSASPTEGVAPLDVSFSDRSTSGQPLSSWFWDFGDGSISHEQNPTHEYNQGTFTVSLRVTSGELSDIITKKNLITITPPDVENPPRVTDGLAVLYRFDEGSGSIVYDVSGVGAPLDLRFADPSKVVWLKPGLQIVSPTAIASIGPAEKINNACRNSNGITLEMWLKPSSIDQSGPARIVSISRNAYSRNVTLAQGLWGDQPTDLFDVRLRTTERSANGMPSFSSPPGSLVEKIRHVVFTRAPDGRARIFVNGTIVAEDTIPGDFSTWNTRLPLLLGNETDGTKPWLGEIYLVAIYSRALSVAEVRLNRDAGRPTLQALAAAPSSTDLFKRFVILGNDGAGASVTTEAYGVQYPDQRCVVCSSNGAHSLTIYDDISKVLMASQSQNVTVRWLD